MRDVSAFQPKRAQGLDYGLISYYRLDEASGNATDSIGSYNLTNNGTTTFGSCKIANGATFGTSNSTKYFSATHIDPDSYNSGFSISFWFNMGTITANMEPFSWGDTSWSGIHMRILSSTSISVRFGNGITSDGGSFSGTVPTMSTGTWYHFAMTHSATENKFYLDGTLIATDSTNVTLSGSTTTFNIGRNTAAVNYWQGSIDEFGIWGKELSSTEITELYNSGSGKQLPTVALSTKAYYPLNGNGAGLFKEGAVAYWRLEDTSDVFGTYTLTNNGTVTFATGKIGNGGTFSNSTTQSLTRASLPFQTKGSISFWAKITTGDTGGYFFDSSSADRYYFYYGANGEGGIGLKGGASITLSNGTIVFNQYNHFVVTWDDDLASNELKLYINGSLNSQATGTITSSTPATFYIGNRYSNTGVQDSMNGTIDEFGVWSKPLSDTEIAMLYAGGAGYQPEFKALDYSGNGNHGTETAITYTQGRFGRAAKFNGTSSKITNTFFQDPDTYNSGMTISGWTYVDTNQNGKMFWHFVENGSWGGIYAQMQSGRYEIRFGSGTVSYVLDTGFTTILGKWTHICMTHDTSNNICYINGRRVASQAAQTLANTGTSFMLGYDNASAYLNGMVDEVIIENRAWTAKEVETYYRKSVLNYRTQGAFANFISYLITAAQGTYTLTGIAAALSSARNMVAALGTFTLTGIDAAFSIGKGIAAALGQFTYTGVDATVKSARTMVGAVGSYTYTGISAILTRGFGFAASVGSYIYTGFSAMLRSPYTWTKRTKNSSTWTNKTKNSSTWTNKNKS